MRYELEELLSDHFHKAIHLAITIDPDLELALGAPDHEDEEEEVPPAQFVPKVTVGVTEPSARPTTTIDDDEGNRLNPKYTFETFVIGSSNRFPHAAAVAVSEAPGRSYNPLLVYGESGLGKSELGLELVSRGHALVADDAVDLYRISQTAIEGRCPELLMNLLEVRGIGLLDIKAIFGETAVRRKMRLKLIVHLVRKETLDRDFERIPTEPLHEEILHIPVRKVVIAVDAGRNLAVLVEAAVRNTILQLRGIDTYREFVQRHQRALKGDNPG